MTSARAIVAASTLALLVYILRLNDVVGMYVDDAWYVLLGQAIASGQGYHLINAAAPEAVAVLPSSPPGFPLVLALVTALTPAFPGNILFLKLVSAIAMFGVGIVSAMYYRDRTMPAPLAAALAFLVVLTPAFVWLATSTVMSEPLFTLAQLGAIVLVARQRPVAGGFAAGAAALVRSAGLPILVAAVAWYVVRREWRAALLFLASALVVLLPWTVYARMHATPLELRLQHGGAHVFTYGEQFWMRRAGDIQSGWISVRELPARVGHAFVDIFGRDVGAIVLPELYRSPIESGEETLSVGGQRDDMATGSMGSASGTLLISGLLSAIALVGFVARCRRGAGVSEYFVPLALVPIVLFPHGAYRLVLPLTPFLYGYLVDGVRAITPAWPRVLRIALVCLVSLHLLDHAQYLMRRSEAVWLQDAREADEVIDWMHRTLLEPGGVASTNPALIYLRTGRHSLAIDNALDRWPAWRSQSVRHLVSLRGGVELPDPTLPYRVVFRTERSGMWVLEATD